jgi:S1-C subfamily serine protease
MSFFQTIFQKISIVILSVVSLVTLANPTPTPTPLPTPIISPTPAPLKTESSPPAKAPIQKTKNSPMPTATKSTTPTRLTNAEIIQKVKPSVVFLQTATGAGSGFIVESSGLILTNAHVVEGTNSVTAKLSNGRVFIGSVLGRNEIIDLALVKIQADNLFAADLGDSDAVAQGDSLYAMGYPFGLEGDVSFKEGVLSRRLTNKGVTYFETSAELHPGNSGGPLVNASGKVIGVNTANFGLSVQGVAVGETIKLAIPINTAKRYIPRLKTGENIVKMQGNPSNAIPPVIPTQQQTPPINVLSAGEDFSQYQSVSLNKLTSNPSVYLNKKIIVSNYINQFLPKGGGGITNYVQLTDPVNFVSVAVDFPNSDDYAKVVAAFVVQAPVKIYGIGAPSAKFSQSNGVTVSVPVIEARRADLCAAGAEYGNTGPDENDPWVLGCYGAWKQILP